MYDKRSELTHQTKEKPNDSQTVYTTSNQAVCAEKGMEQGHIGGWCEKQKKRQQIRRNDSFAVGMDLKKGRCMDSEDPFKDLKIKNWMILEDISERQPCIICKKSRKYFCYNCYIPVQSLQGHVPLVKVMFYIV